VVSFSGILMIPFTMNNYVPRLVSLMTAASLVVCMTAGSAGQCSTDFNDPSIAQSSTLTMSDNTTSRSPTVNIVSHKFAMKGIFVSNITSHCDVTVLADVTVRVQLVMFILRRQSVQRDQCVQVSDGDTVQGLCSANDPVIILACTDAERKIAVRYVTGSASVNVAFEVQLQASTPSTLSISCGQVSNSGAPAPVADDSILANDTTTEVTSWFQANLNGIAIASVVGGLTLIAVIMRHIFGTPKSKSRQPAIQLLAQDVDRMVEQSTDEGAGSSSDGIKLISNEYDCAIDRYHKDLCNDSTDV